MTTDRIGASFRDPSGYLFKRDSCLYRQVNQVYALNYSRLMESGLYDKLVKAGLLISHEEVTLEPLHSREAYKILKPENVPFISYPYEWSFSQLKEAALATLSIQKRALKYGLSLKDASAYNIQFHQGKALLIDTLSFETYEEGEPWVAYRQFCQHFLAPLVLMSKCDVRLGQLLRIYIDGIPLDLTSQLLPGWTRLNFGMYAHIHLHARAQKKYADVPIGAIRAGRTMNKQAMLGLIKNLDHTIRQLKWKPASTEWGDYYDATNYTPQAFADKKDQVCEWAQRIRPRMIWDLGANTGVFARAIAGRDSTAVAYDIDPLAVERSWLQVKREKEKNILPLLIDLTNPSPAIGWNNQERMSFQDRGPAGMILALALIHHLAIANNLPFDMIAKSLSNLGEWLVIEFVPKTDSQVQRLLQSRKDIFDNYSVESFRAEFEKYYDIMETRLIKDSLRSLFLMKRKASTVALKQ